MEETLPTEDAIPTLAEVLMVVTLNKRLAALKLMPLLANGTVLEA